MFIDELDALGKARGMQHAQQLHEREQSLNQLLAEMDGFNPNKGVILMAATNGGEIRSGVAPSRTVRPVKSNRPHIKGREKIIQLHARKIKLSPAVDLSIIAAKTPGVRRRRLGEHRQRSRVIRGSSGQRSRRDDRL